MGLLASPCIQLWIKIYIKLTSPICHVIEPTWSPLPLLQNAEICDLSMQRRVKTYGRRSTRVVYIDDAFPPFQSSSLTAPVPPTNKVPSSTHPHKLQPAKPSTSVITGLRKSSKAPVVLSDSDSESDISTHRKPLDQLSPNLRRTQGTSRGPEIAKPHNKQSSRRPARVVQISSSSESSDGEESRKQKSIKRTSTAPSRLGTRFTATPALRGSTPARAPQPRRTTPATYDLSSDEDAQTTSATQAPTTSDSETEASASDAPARPLKRGVSNRSPIYTRRTTTRTIVLSSPSEGDWQGVTSSSDDQPLPILTGESRLFVPYART